MNIAPELIDYAAKLPDEQQCPRCKMPTYRHVKTWVEPEKLREFICSICNEHGFIR